jgi:uncharacterized protein
MSTALITGASGGIGKAFAQELAARQTNLVLVARSEEKLHQLAQELQQQYKVQVDVIVQDLTEPDAAGAVFDATTAKGLTIDTLINNAGFGDYGDFAKSDRTRQVKIVQLNVAALVDLTHRYLPLMRQRGSGSIINVASIAGFQPIPYLSVYAASKAFIISFSEALWAENRPYNIRVLVTCPGPTETDFFTEANFPQALAETTNKVMGCKEVVLQSLKALENWQPTVIVSDTGTQFRSAVARLVPRKTLLSLLARHFKS